MKHTFNAAKGLVILPLHVFGPMGDSFADVAVDTGATRTMINADVLVGLGYDPARGTGSTKIITGSGVVYATQLSVEKVEALGVSVSPFTVLCHTLPVGAAVHGILGLDFFRGRCVSFGFRQGFIEVS